MKGSKWLRKTTFTGAISLAHGSLTDKISQRNSGLFWHGSDPRQAVGALFVSALEAV